jgi:hypothetical protein
MRRSQQDYLDFTSSSSFPSAGSEVEDDWGSLINILSIKIECYNAESIRFCEDYLIKAYNGGPYEASHPPSRAKQWVLSS